jgi:hypothetical protein
MFVYSLLLLTVLSGLGISYFVYFTLYQNHRDLSVTEAFIGIISQFVGAWCVIIWIIYGVYRVIILFL